MAAVMRYCGPRGIPYEDFLDWGQLSKDAAMAWQADEDDHCAECGQRRSEWFDENGKELRDPPTLPVEVKCPSCEALEELRAEPVATNQKGIKHAFRPVEIFDDETGELVQAGVASSAGDGDALGVDE